MLADQSTYMPAEVAADVKKVMDAYTKALSDVSDEAATGLTGMKKNIDDWAARGKKAAATRADTPGAKGWPGWVSAGTIYLQGIEDIDKTLSHVKLDAITAQALNVPQTTTKAAVETVGKIAKKTSEAATKAVHAVEEVGASVGKGISTVATRVAIAAAVVLVLVVAVRR